MLSFTSVLSEFPTFGHSFIVSGKTLPNANSFTLALTCGKVPNSDVALMIWADFNEKRIKRSSFIGGVWTASDTTENITGSALCPIERDSGFIIYILVSEEKFHVSIDGETFCTYPFKIPVKNIMMISVGGDLECVTQADHRKVFPLVYPLSNNDYDNVAFEGFIPKHYAKGHVVVISGVIGGSPQGEFVIMFNEEGSTRQLIHFNTRFNEGCVVMNTMHEDNNESWSDAEVRAAYFPFAIGQPFKIAFAFTDIDCRVAVNGQGLMAFNLSNIALEEQESVEEILTGFQATVCDGLELRINHVEHIKMSEDCAGFEFHSN